jgi:murein DD-endopeptidase MepM/ murein hydrolase activator NlpD
MSSSKMFRRIVAFILTFLLIVSATPVSAQTATPPPGPVYIVQAGDTLWSIASQFNVAVADIQAINNMTSTDIFVGDKLVIPGLAGLSGTLITQPVPFGETLRSLSREYRMDPATLEKLNHIVSPTEVYAGYGLIILQQDNQSAWTSRASLGQGETMLELAIKGNSDPWSVAQINGLTEPSAGLPGDILYLPSGNSQAAPSGLPAAIVSAQVDPLPLFQGTTAQIKVVSSQNVTLGGLLVDHPLHFFATDANTQVALQGVYAALDPGLYPLRIDVTQADGSVQSFEQMVLVNSGNYPTDPGLDVDPTTIDPAVTGPEDQWLLSLTSVVTPEKYWNGAFQLPVGTPSCIRAGFGDRRSYNGGALLNFHTGVDFGVCSPAHPLDIYAAADGVVVFTGLKTVRGNATIVDDGQGVFTCYYHQSKFLVSVGDHVKAGQLIGQIGATGRVTGPHLHFEVWVNGIQVNPLLWLSTVFPH